VTIVSAAAWRWGNKYPVNYVNILFHSIRRNLSPKTQLQFICISDDDRGLDPAIDWLPIQLLPPPAIEAIAVMDGCYARLVVFDPDFPNILNSAGIEPPKRLTVFDLDAVVCGPMDALFMRQEPFIIAQGIHYLHTKFNGSLIQLKLGYRPDVWTDFSVEAARPFTYHQSPEGDLVYQSTDQSWLFHKFGGRAAQFTPRGSGVYGYGKPGWPQGGTALPANARIVFFPGQRDPKDPVLQEKLPWIKEHWRT
jgi:hypothetical protein